MRLVKKERKKREDDWDDEEHREIFLRREALRMSRDLQTEVFIRFCCVRLLPFVSQQKARRK